MAKNATTKPGRSMWKGQLKLSLINCSVALYKATSSVERVSFNMMHRATGNRLKQQYVNSVTNVVVEPDNRCKGYEVGKGQYILIEDDELKAIRPEGDKVINLETCVRPDEVPSLFRDETYFLLPEDHVAEEAFALIRETLAMKKLAGVGKLMLRSRQRPVIVEPSGLGLQVTTLRFQAEVRSASDYFAHVRPVTLAGELLQLAGQLIDSKMSDFDPTLFVDAYEEAVVELVRAKQAGKAFTAPQEREANNVTNLLEALKSSLEGTGTSRKPPAKVGKTTKGKGKKAA